MRCGARPYIRARAPLREAPIPPQGAIALLRRVKATLRRELRDGCLTRRGFSLMIYLTPFGLYQRMVLVCVACVVSMHGKYTIEICHPGGENAGIDREIGHT